MKARNVIVVIVLFGFLMTLGGPVIGASASDATWSNSGPYVDKIVYKVISNQDQRILALQAGEIEMDTSFLDPVYFQSLADDPNIDIFKALRNGYGHITINCDKYPLNISALRRAFAFAFDKTAVTVQILDGFSQEHDSLVPYPNGWCIEDELPYHYYTDQAIIGNSLLDDAGFTFDVNTGFRLAPDGSAFNINFEYADSSPEIAGGVAQIGVDALRSLGIDAEARAADFNEYITRVDNNGDFDMVFYAINFYSNDVDWLAYEYWSEYADIPYQNPTNFRNAEYDSWRDQLLYGTTYEEVFEASAEMQKILQYEVPRLVVYENTYMQGYRNDQFTGHVEDLGRYISGPWTQRKIQKLDGTFGGTVPIALSQEPDGFNIYTSDTVYSTHIFDNIYSSLYKSDPDVTPCPDLAEALLTETHNDNPSVPAGHVRYTFNIVQNATWSDGVQLSARDVAFTFNYMREHGFEDLSQLYAAYAPSDYQFVAEFIGESYWFFGDIAYSYIIPMHIWKNIDVPQSYSPNWDEMITSGPFYISDSEAGEFYELTKNPFFYYLPADYDSSSDDLPMPAACTYVSPIPPVNIEDPPSIVSDGVTPAGPTMTSTFTSNWDSTPTSFTDGETIIGDHVVIDTSWTDLPSQLDRVELELVTGTVVERTGTIAEPYGDLWPISLSMTDHYKVEIIENIHAGETVHCMLHMEPYGNDPSFAVYAWLNGGFGQEFLSVDSGGSDYDESGSFVAPYDMTIAVVVYAWSWAYTPGTYQLTIDTLASILATETGPSISYDTYYFANGDPMYFSVGVNFTVDIVARAFVTLEDETEIVYTDNIQSVEVCNFFAPDVTVITPNGGEVWTGIETIDWISNDLNMYEDSIHEVYVSNDGGSTYMLLGKDIEAFTFIWDTTNWQLLESYKVMIRTSDGVLWGDDCSDTTFTAGVIPVEDTRAPIIFGADTRTISEGLYSNYIIWRAYDLHPDRLEVWLDDSLISAEDWITNEIVINCDFHTPGGYNYTLLVIDDFGNRDSMTTWLVVEPSSPPQNIWSGIAAFEEYYDNDYNDWVCGIDIYAHIDPYVANMVHTMSFEFEGLARGAGYHHVQHLRILPDTFTASGTYTISTYSQYGFLIDVTEPISFNANEELDIIAIADSWDALPPHDPVYGDARMANVYDGSGIQTGPISVVSFTFDSSFYLDVNQYSIDNIGVHGEGLFFDPWMEVPSAEIAVHMGHEWALITPSDWIWPDELSPIWDVYPVVDEGPPVFFPADWYMTYPTEFRWQPWGDLGTIVFDYSHGQYKASTEWLDIQLARELLLCGYDVVWARGGINESLLSNAEGLVISPVRGELNLLTSNEISTISNWFDSGMKFLWVGCDSDYEGQYVNDNMVELLEMVGSHVYPEPTSMEDPISNAGASYRPIATEPGSDPFVHEFTVNTDSVIMHGPTCLYGSTSGQHDLDVIPLESSIVTNVYTLLSYSPFAQIVDFDTSVLPYAHMNGDEGSFVAATLEVEAGLSKSSVLVVSGSSPYGYYLPMYADEYYGISLTGDNLVRQTILNGIELAGSSEPVYDTTPPETTVTGPPSGSTVGDDTTYTIESDDESGVATTLVYLDGELVLTEDGAIVNYILDPTIIADGQHTLTIVVYDNFGNEQVTVYVIFTDTTPPDVQTDIPLECSGDCDFEVDATDENGIDRVEFWLDGVLRIVDYTDPYVFYVHTPDLVDGEHTLEIIVYDTVGNYRVVVRIFIVDNTAPELLDFSQDFINGIPGWNLSVSATVADFSSLSSVHAIIHSSDGYYINIPMTHNGAGTYEAVWNSPTTLIGQFTIDINATDAHGNIGTYNEVSWVHLYDYLSLTATHADLELIDDLGSTLNRSWNDFYDTNGEPLAYFIDDGVSVNLLILNPTSELYQIMLTYLDGSEYTLHIIATSGGSIIYDEIYNNTVLSSGDVHQYLVSYTDSVTVDSEALPEVVMAVTTDSFYILPGDYLQCQLNWFNLDPGVAREVEIILEYSEYLEFVSCSYPVVINGDQIILNIGSVNGFSLEYVELTFYMVNLLACNGDELWLNATMNSHDDWFVFDYQSKDNQLITVVTQLPENIVQTSWWWKSEFTFALGSQESTYDLNYLQTLVTMISYSSELFSDVTTLEQALGVLILNDYKGLRGLALRELYGVWLNLANDALTSDTIIDLGNLTTAGTVGEAILECELVLMDDTASAQELLGVMRICQEINAGRY